MVKSRIIRPSLVLLIVALVGEAYAHQPVVATGTESDPDHAIRLPDAAVSRVVYAELTDAAPQVWIALTNDAPRTLHFGLGVPLIERLADYRPAVALLGPGLPTLTDAPFEVPSGLGGYVFDTTTVTDPEHFDEPFSGTSSWIVGEYDAALPAAGTYYLVGFHPQGAPGKLWIAPGREEAFELDDILALPAVLEDVRAFHEVSSTAAVPCFLFPLGLACLGLALTTAARVGSHGCIPQTVAKLSVWDRPPAGLLREGALIARRDRPKAPEAGPTGGSATSHGMHAARTL